MTGLNVIENKISATKKYLGILEEYKKYSREEIEKDMNIKGALERYLYLAVQSAVDLAEAFVSYKKFRKPATLAEAFHILHENKIISGELTDKMVKMTGFRNVVAHDYEKIDYDIVYKILHEGPTDIEEFLTKISSG